MTDDSRSKRVIFGLPLIGRRLARDWDLVTHQLSATLGSLCQQSAADFHIIVACTDEPELPAAADRRLELLACPGRPDNNLKAMREDIRRKRFAIARRARELGGGYLMFVDADDLVSSGLVAFIEQHPHPHGYILAEGYVFDPTTGSIAPYPIPGFERWPLDRICGTSAIVRFSADELPENGSAPSAFARLFGGGHYRVRNRCKDAGRPLEPLPIRAVVYVRAVRQAISFRQGGDGARLEFHRRLVQHIPLNAIERTPRLDRMFNLKSAVLPASGIDQRG